MYNRIVIINRYENLAGSADFFDLCRIYSRVILNHFDKLAKTLAILIFTGHSLQSTHPTPNVGMRHSFFCVNEYEGSFGHVNN